MSTPVSTPELEYMTVGDVCDYLEDKGFPDHLLEIFRDQELDGRAIKYGLGTSPGSEWLKDVVPILGLRLKVHNILRSLCIQEQIKSPPPLQKTQFESPTSETPTGSTVSVHSSVDGDSKVSSLDSANAATPSRPKKDACLPLPFPIPMFRHSTEENLSKYRLLTEDRIYMVQVLATVLMTYVQRPSKYQCSLVAKSLLRKLTFLQEGDPEAENSWQHFIYYRCTNVNRDKNKDPVDPGQPRKRSKLIDSTAHVVPPPNADDDISFGRNLELLQAEMGKKSQRSDAIKLLMRRTFANRWKKYTDPVEPEPSSLNQYLLEYPCLKKLSYCTQEFELLTQKETIRDHFEEELVKWAHGIVLYCRDTQRRSTAIQAEIETYSDDITDDCVCLMAFRCLAILMCNIKTKKLENLIPFIMKVVPRGTPVKEAIEPAYTQPYIVHFMETDEDCLQQYFISIERNLILEANNFTSAIFAAIAAHYVFNLSYHKKCNDFWVFFQENVLNLPAKGKKSPSSSVHFSGIKRCFNEFYPAEPSD